MAPWSDWLKDLCVTFFKICRDTELHSFLDDDNMMDLLVDGKIMHLDLKLGLSSSKNLYQKYSVVYLSNGP